MLYCGMERAQLDVAYNYSAPLPTSVTRLSPIGRYAAPRCGVNTPAILTLPTAIPRASGSICFLPPIRKRRLLRLSTAATGR